MPPEPLTLAFDTAAAHCAAALVSGKTVLAQRHEHMARGQAERLFPLLEEVLKEGGATWRDLARIGVGIGPGNFTGIRISVAAARGLALSLAIPAIGVSAFQAIAEAGPRPALALVDGRAGRIHGQLFAETGPLAPPFTATPEELVTGEYTRNGAYLIGENSEEIARRTNAANARICPPAAPVAVSIGRIAARADPAAHPPAAPLYMRPADAASSRVQAPRILP